LYGIDASRRGFLISEDDGLTWLATSTQRFTWATGQGADYVSAGEDDGLTWLATSTQRFTWATGQGADYVSAVTMPWVQGSGLTSAAPVAPYVVATWGGRLLSTRIIVHFRF